ncbi:MAG: hypothetical protein JXL82_03995 [Candidatus Omnitrophica bacterium]|nr:hypothetical protein [Candidatus Omnitrophota bacterium]
MTKLKLSSKNSARSALLLLNIIPFVLCGCFSPKEHTYKEEEIPQIIEKICKEEYGLNVVTKRAENTLWIYAPMERILHKDYGTTPDKIFDEDMSGKLRDILITTGRVLMSSDNTPAFFGILASDTNLGINYTLIGNTLDMRMSYSGFIPWTESNRRYIIKFEQAPQAIGDTSGLHFNPYNVDMADFLALQISQRIGWHFQNERIKEYFKVERSEGKFENGTFYFDYYIEEISRPKQKIKIRDEILGIVSYCLKTYGFEDFSTVMLTDLRAQEKLYYPKKEILSWPTEF